MQKNENYSTLEAAFLTAFNQGFKTFDTLKDKVPYSEGILNNVINGLVQKNIIKYDKNSNSYLYDTPVLGEKIILTGNIMLPVTVIRQPDRTIVIRGNWYEFEPDFDLRRIIWNVATKDGKSTSIIEMIKDSVLKERKSKIVQDPDWKSIQSKVVPFNQNIKLFLNTIGTEQSDIDIIFVLKLPIHKDNDLTGNGMIQFNGLKVKSLIKTEELITELTRENKEDINFENIQLNKIFNFSDFVFKGNEIPTSILNDKIEYFKITGISGKIQLTFYELSNTNQVTKINVEDFLDVKEGINYIKQKFDEFAKDFLLKNNFLVDLY